MQELETDWISALRGTDEERDAAIATLRSLLLRNLQVAFRRRSEVSEAQLEDFAQVALVRILDRLDRFEGRSRFTTWAQAIAINVAFAELRRKRWQDLSLDALMADGRQLDGLITGRETGFDDRSEQEHVLTVLRRGMAEKLTDRQRAAIAGQLRDVPVDQLVGLLGTTRGAFYKLVHDARRALKDYLSAEGISAEYIRKAFHP